MSRLGTLNGKEADQLSRGLGFAGNAYKIGRRLRAIGLEYTSAVATWEPRIIIGTSSVPITLATYANHAIEIYTTCASADGSNSVTPIYMYSAMTGAGGVGGRAHFQTHATAALGGWCNAVKGLMSFADSTGRVTGLASAVCAETILSTGTTQGNYCALEAELIANSAVSTGTSTGFLFCNIGGSNSTGKATINSNAFFAIFGELVTMGSSDDTAIVTTIHADSVATHQVRCRAPDGSDLWFLATTETPSGS